MAPVLLCPECGAKHPLDGVNGAAFLCEGCGRTLKVPQPAGVAAKAAPTGSTPARDPNATRVVSIPKPAEPVAFPAEPRVPARPPGRAFNPVPARWVRFLVWFIAVPLAFVIMFVGAKLIGVLSSNQVEDVALDEGWMRFLPIVRLLPFVALVTAAVVHGSVYGLSRLRVRRHGQPVSRGKP